jgi:hypothetical protein
MAHRRKRSVSFDPHLDARIEAAASAAGMTVSAWLSRCVEDRLINDDGLVAMQEYEALFGPFSTAELERAEIELDDAFAAAQGTTQASRRGAA